MQFSEEWKSIFPVSTIHSPPLLLSQASLGPLLFNPVPESLALLYSSSHLSPPFIPPPSRLSLPRFLETSTTHDFPVLPSIACAISPSLNAETDYSCGNNVLHNRLEPLYCPNNLVLIFFPTGSNFDCVGFMALSAKDSKLAVEFSSEKSALASKMKFDHHIVRLLACPLSDDCVSDVGGSTRVGFLLVRCMYSVHWLSVQITGLDSDTQKPALVLKGSKLFKSCAVVYACWNPHLLDESVVLLESGALFLFDMDSSCVETRFKGKRISVAWDKLGESAGNGWFSCEFIWHPRIMIVANSKAIYLVDFRFEKCDVSCLLRVETLGVIDMPEKDQFVALSKAGPDGFFYTVSSEHWLLLCDVRKPSMPVLRWAHHLLEPRYMSVLPLSELRAHPCSDEHTKASETGYVVILGSFWNNEFKLYCYGRPLPSTEKSFATKISNFSDSVYAWGLPSQLMLSRQSCPCGSCLLREEFAKDDLPEWISWQEKTDLVLGFCILNKDISCLLPKAGDHGSFTLLRLMSSGKLECQQYSASSETPRTVETSHGKKTPCINNSLQFSIDDEKYKFPRRFKYLELKYLTNHLTGNLANLMCSKFKNAPSSGIDEHFLNFIRGKLKPYGCELPLLGLSAVDVFKDANTPTTLYEIVSKKLWTAAPMNILQMAFPKHKEVLDDETKEFLEFPVIPDQSQLPPFFSRSLAQRPGKGSSKLKCSDDFTGPVLPLPAALVLSEICQYGHYFTEKVNDFSLEEAIAHQCKSVIQSAKEVGVPISTNKQDKEYAVSLKRDKDERWIRPSDRGPFFMYKPSAFSDESYNLDAEEEPKDSVHDSERFEWVVAKFAQDEGKLFDGLCPMELSFNGDMPNVDEDQIEHKFLKEQFLKWQNGFVPYKNLCTQLELNK